MNRIVMRIDLMRLDATRNSQCGNLDGLWTALDAHLSNAAVMRGSARLSCEQ